MTDTDKLAVMEWGLVWEPGLPLLPGTIDQADQQQLLWGFPGVLWAAASAGAGPAFWFLRRLHAHIAEL